MQAGLLLLEFLDLALGRGDPFIDWLALVLQAVAPILGRPDPLVRDRLGGGLPGAGLVCRAPLELRGRDLRHQPRVLLVLHGPVPRPVGLALDAHPHQRLPEAPQGLARRLLEGQRQVQLRVRPFLHAHAIRRLARQDFKDAGEESGLVAVWGRFGQGAHPQLVAVQPPRLDLLGQVPGGGLALEVGCHPRVGQARRLVALLDPGVVGPAQEIPRQAVLQPAQLALDDAPIADVVGQGARPVQQRERAAALVALQEAARGLAQVVDPARVDLAPAGEQGRLRRGGVEAGGDRPVRLLELTGEREPLAFEERVQREQVVAALLVQKRRRQGERLIQGAGEALDLGPGVGAGRTSALADRAAPVQRAALFVELVGQGAGGEPLQFQELGFEGGFCPGALPEGGQPAQGRGGIRGCLRADGVQLGGEAGPLLPGIEQARHQDLVAGPPAGPFIDLDFSIEGGVLRLRVHEEVRRALSAEPVGLGAVARVHDRGLHGQGHRLEV
jgi:hypothetical protein